MERAARATTTRRPVDTAQAPDPGARRWLRLGPAILLMLAAIVGFYLLREHWEHLTGRWAYLLLLACPLIHLFGHGGHGRGDGQHGRGADRSTARPTRRTQ
jgi:hypothetical protein